MTRIRLSEIVFDAGTQIRAAINEATVAEYAELMTTGTEFPPVVLFHDGNHYYMADGFHRGLAAQRNQFRDIDAEIRPGTKQDALWFALGANKANGQRLTEADKKHAIRLAVMSWPDKSAPMIAIQIGCTEQYVRDVRRQIEPESGFVLKDRTVGRDGKQHPTSRAAIEKKRQQIEELVRQGKSNDEIKSAVGGTSNDTIALVRKSMGVSKLDKSKVAIAKRRKDVRDMAERGFTTRQIAAAIGIGEQAIGDIAKKEGVTIHADRVVGKTKRHDANRIVGQMVMDAENLCADVNLIEFPQLDRSQLSAWIHSLNVSRKALSAFIRRLEQEQKRHGEAA